MPSGVDRLKALFGWGSPTSTRKTPPLDSTDPIYNAHNPSDMYHDMMQTRRRNRKNRYDVYDSMDKMADVASVLDAYAEDATLNDNQHEATVWIEGKDKKVVDACNEMLKNIDVEQWIEGVARDLGKHGDDFSRIVGGDGDGVLSLEWLDPRDIERIENREGILIGFEATRGLGDYKKKLQDDPKSMPKFAPWDILHFRIYKQKRLPYEKQRHIYGTSLMWASDRIAKQIKILDDLLMIVRLTRSLDRKIYYVDVGRSPVEEEIRILQRWRRSLKRKTFIDPVQGRFDSRFNPWAWTEDEFWPVKKDSNSRVEPQPGLGSVGEMVDIDHFRDKFFGSFRAPKAYFGYEGDINAKATLSSQSIRWARAVNSLQRGVKQGLTRLCQIHLAWKGLDHDIDNFKVMMVAPSVIELLDRLEAWQNIIDVAERMSAIGETMGLDKLEWTKYILENVMWLGDQDVRKFSKLLEKAAKEGDLNPDGDEDGNDKKPDELDPPEEEPVVPPNPDEPEKPAPEKPAPPPKAPPKKPPEEKPEKKKTVVKKKSSGRKESLTEIDEVISSVVHRQRFAGARKGELPSRKKK